MMEWISLDLILSLLLLIVGAFATIVSVSYREVMKTVEVFLEHYKIAMEDSKLSDKEKKQLAVDALDFMTELLSVITGMKWLSLIVRRKK